MKDNKPRCGCGLYVGYEADNGTYYGCKDPEAPEPLDPYYFCKKCVRKDYKNLKQALIEHGEGKISCPWWLKPDWYMKAIKDAGFTLNQDVHTYSLTKIEAKV